MIDCSIRLGSDLLQYKFLFFSALVAKGGWPLWNGPLIGRSSNSSHNSQGLEF